MPLAGLRAAEYAGWWNSKPQVTITTSSVVSDTVYQTPAYSLLVNSTNLNWAVPNTGSIDLTGYTSLSGYNSKRGTTFVTLYLEWPSTYTPGDNASAGTFNELRDGTTTYYDNISIAWN